MRRLAIVLVLGVLTISSVANAVEPIQVCWTERALDMDGLQYETVTRCRVAGEIVDYGSEGEVPGSLYPDVGVAANGTCWFWRSGWSGWVILVRYGDGTASMGFDSDGVVGGPVALDATYPMCTSEPVPAVPNEVLVWDLIEEYVHQRPDPALNPPPPWGLTGAVSFVSVVPPVPF
jgi:hypothetical protein